MKPVAWIDLRSDTVTQPEPGMRAAMAVAEVGDDVYGDDPTVNRLQDLMAGRFGYERCLFFPSGTQSNLAALMAHCGRGDEPVHHHLHHGWGLHPAPIQVGALLAFRPELCACLAQPQEVYAPPVCSGRNIR